MKVNFNELRPGRAHPVPIRNDFHMVLLWFRSLEIAGGQVSAGVSESEMEDLFRRYRSPWKA